MTYTDEELRQAETAILAYLSRSRTPFAPVKMLEALDKEGLSEFPVRAAIWFLIDRNEVTLTSDRKLTLAKVENTQPSQAT